MKIDVVAKVDEIKLEDTLKKTIIVIDVLRATSTIVTALAHGAKEVIPVETVGQARQFRGEHYLLAGERYGKRVTGFPYTNSPTEISSAPISGQSLVLTTTNGTRAIQKSLKASHILIGSLLNGSSCANMAIELRKDLTILCAGSRQKFALEDGIAAGYILTEIAQSLPEIFLNDLGTAMLAAYTHYEDRLEQVLTETATGKRLMQNNGMDDIIFCAQRNKYDFVPVMKGGSIIPQFPNLSKE